MPTYVTLGRFTDQGIKGVRDTTQRAKAVGQAIERLGGKMTAIYWTQGSYDLITITDFPDEETAMQFLLSVGIQGNVRTETMRAYSSQEMDRILPKVS